MKTLIKKISTLGLSLLALTISANAATPVFTPDSAEEKTLVLEYANPLNDALRDSFAENATNPNFTEVQRIYRETFPKFQALIDRHPGMASATHHIEGQDPINLDNKPIRNIIRYFIFYRLKDAVCSLAKVKRSIHIYFSNHGRCKSFMENIIRPQTPEDEDFRKAPTPTNNTWWTERANDLHTYITKQIICPTTDVERSKRTISITQDEANAIAKDKEIDHCIMVKATKHAILPALLASYPAICMRVAQLTTQQSGLAATAFPYVTLALCCWGTVQLGWTTIKYFKKR